MATDDSGPTAVPSSCDRCGDSLPGSHWIRLSAIHRGAGAERYLDVDRRICADCVAALGMLEFEPAVWPSCEARKSRR
nr:hypothetical protein [Halovivax limisalsi]